MGSTRRTMHRHLWTGMLLLLALVLGLVVAGPSGPAAAAAISAGVQEVRFVTTSLAFGGQSFGPAGKYEQVRGTIVGAIDPADSRNAPIVDLANAPRNEAGLVEYEVDFVLLRPADPTRGNHRVVYEPTN